MSNNWSGDGFPPVGTECEYTAVDHCMAHPYIDRKHFYRCKIIAYYNGYVWTSDNGIRMLVNTVFRPIKSDRDKAIEEMLSIWQDSRTIEDTMENIYDSGFRKQSGE